MKNKTHHEFSKIINYVLNRNNLVSITRVTSSIKLYIRHSKNIYYWVLYNNE